MKGRRKGKGEGKVRRGWRATEDNWEGCDWEMKRGKDVLYIPLGSKMVSWVAVVAVSCLILQVNFGVIKCGVAFSALLFCVMT